MHDTVRQDDIDGSSETLDDLDFEHGTLELREVHESLTHSLLRELDQQHDHVRDTFTCDGGSWYQGDISTKVLVLVIEDRVESLLGEGELGLLKTVLKFSLGAFALLSVGLSESAVGDWLPAVTSIDFVERNDERRLPFSQQTDGLEGLGFQTVL